MAPSALATSRSHATYIHVMRLLPGDDLLLSIREFVKTQALGAAFIITCVGSVGHCRLRPGLRKRKECIQKQKFRSCDHLQRLRLPFALLTAVSWSSAGVATPKTWDDRKFEIVSLTGTMECNDDSSEASEHLHMSVSVSVCCISDHRAAN